MSNKNNGSMMGSIVIALLVTVVPIAGLIAGYMPIRGVDGSLDDNPVKFYIGIALWLVLSFVSIFFALVEVHNLFKKYGGNYNWATIKAIYKGSKWRIKN